MKKLLDTKEIEFKVSLRGSKPLIWRNLSVESDISFYEFHEILQMAMGWEDYHLFNFMVDGFRIESIDESFDAMDNSSAIDADDITLENALFNADIKKFTYEYDFGDAWLHDLEILNIRPLRKEMGYPICFDGKMNCPPEDCGGIPGFYHFLEVIGDKKHPDHKSMWEWIGEEKYDPEHFNIKEINRKFVAYENGYYENESELYENEEDYDLDLADSHLDEIFDGLFKPLEVKVVNKSKHALPSYESEASAGMDLRANLEKEITLKTLERTIVKTGLFIELPIGCEAQVRPRSGLAAKHGITVLNSPGTIDADYRGEIGVILVNLSNEDFKIKDGDRIAQLVIARHEQIKWESVEKLGETSRGEGGFGSTGV